LTATATKKFVYYGSSDLEDLDAQGVKDLESRQLMIHLTGGAYSFSPGGYKFVAVHSSVSRGIVFLDRATLLSVTMEELRPVDIDGEFYRLYRTRYKLMTGVTFQVRVDF